MTLSTPPFLLAPAEDPVEEVGFAGPQDDPEIIPQALLKKYITYAKQVRDRGNGTEECGTSVRAMVYQD